MLTAYKFKFTTANRQPVVRDIMATDDILRVVLGDTEKTTALLMELTNGSRSAVTFTRAGVEVTVQLHTEEVQCQK